MTPERKPLVCFLSPLSASHKAATNVAGHYLAVLCLTLYAKPSAR